MSRSQLLTEKIHLSINFVKVPFQKISFIIKWDSARESEAYIHTQHSKENVLILISCLTELSCSHKLFLYGITENLLIFNLILSLHLGIRQVIKPKQNLLNSHSI